MTSPDAQDDDLPGMLALAKGVAEQKWPHTMDAKVWAKEFMDRYLGVGHDPSMKIDEDTMLGWFANAIMAGYDTAQMRAARAPSPDAQDVLARLDDPALGRIYGEAGARTCHDAAALIRALRSEVERLQGNENDAIKWQEENARNYDRAERAEAERDAAAKDAERYRWLRDVGDENWTALCTRASKGSSQIDAAIDAALGASTITVTE